MKVNGRKGILALMLSALLAYGCAPGALADAPAASAAPTEDARPEVDDSVVAVMGGEQITAQETAELYSYVLDMYSYYGYDASDPEVLMTLQDATLDAAIMMKVEQLMEVELGLDEFSQAEMDEMSAEAQATYEATRAEVRASLDDGTLSEDELDESALALMDSYGYTVDALVEQAKLDAMYERLYAELTADVSVTDDEVAEYYAQLVESDRQMYEGDPASYTIQCMYGARPAYTPEGIRTVKHILIKYLDEDAQQINELVALSEKPDDYEEQYEALKQAAYQNIKPTVDEVMELIAQGEDFDALVEQYGQDPGMESEPYKSEGYMVYEGATTLVAEFVEGAMALESVGDVSAEPALTDYGAHILLYFSDLEPGEAELTDERAESVREELLTQRRSDAYDAALTEYRDSLGEIYLYPEHLVREDLSDEQEAVEQGIIAEDAVVIEGDAAEAADEAEAAAEAEATAEPAQG